jgi:hypothetical protein
VNIEDGTGRLSRNVGNQLPFLILEDETRCCVASVTRVSWLDSSFVDSFFFFQQLTPGVKVTIHALYV